jgi:hypothetical protein
VRRALIFLFLAACGPGHHGADAGVPDAGPCFIGDPSLAPEVEVMYQATDGTAQLAQDGGAMPIIEAPQGGKFFVIGVRARNVTCRAQLQGAIHDLCNMHSPFDARPITLVEGPDGWGTPKNPGSVQNYANIPACPAPWAARDIRNTPYQFLMHLVDLDGRTADAQETLVPYCADSDPTLRAICDCRCRLGYVLGDPCGVIPDAGPPAACP